jgi:DNA/RNA endonuclease YhcR with UshA esterase domain
VNESTEGLLVQVVGTITQAVENDLPFGYKIFVDDGSGEITIFVNTQTGIDVSGFSAGQTVSVTGFSSQFDDHYEIDPRFPADIVVQTP